ncbi:TetR/AcrR family transcriptional regulator [Actinomadura rupiterrae]|uniref:TetR/AcrR family transcriptional regulator n=1 Tax=Actinomadura rupiterrae TaxID=559627 RepID=UPI0020A2FC62|nr:TetR family transcriptional regulator C-terminal domain-containing protein [Actinomadura rupiterrae]MCP2335504.1 AcrR family transcriptional regulator [Actinomadura rupiterrae]
MPARGDHDARRRDVSAAVWRVLAADGFGGLTLRAVAAEMGSSTGLLTHYFPNKKALLAHALDLAEERTLAGRTTPAGRGLAALRELLADVLPISAEAVEMNRVWVSSWDAALADADLGERETGRYERFRTLRLRPFVKQAVELGELPADADPDDITTMLAGFAHGLVVQVLFDPVRYPPARQLAMLDRMLAGLSA